MKSTKKQILLTIILILSCFSLYGCSDKSRADTRTQADIHNQSAASEAGITETPDPASSPEAAITPESIPDKDSDPDSYGHTDSADNTEDKNTNEPITGAPEPTVTTPPEKQESSPEPSFKEASETVYAVSNVNVRTSCSTKADNVIAVLQKGASVKRIGISEGWSKVLFQKEEGYIKNEYLSTEKPAKEDFAAKLAIASDISKLIVVVGNGGADCTVSYHTRDKNGKWTQQFSTDGDCGYKGITYHKKEGDGKTPAGLYSFTLAFGIKPDPGAQLTYRQVTEYDYWVDDTESPYYNTWINSLENPGDYTGEHLIDHSPQYNYVLNINYNSDNTPGLGSAIFLHGYNGKGQTTGCVALSEKYVKTLVREADSSTRILIVPDKEDLDNY